MKHLRLIQSLLILPAFSLDADPHKLGDTSNRPILPVAPVVESHLNKGVLTEYLKGSTLGPFFKGVCEEGGNASRLGIQVSIPYRDSYESANSTLELLKTQNLIPTSASIKKIVRIYVDPQKANIGQMKNFEKETVCIDLGPQENTADPCKGINTAVSSFTLGYQVTGCLSNASFTKFATRDLEKAERTKFPLQYTRSVFLVGYDSNQFDAAKRTIESQGFQIKDVTPYFFEVTGAKNGVETFCQLRNSRGISSCQLDTPQRSPGEIPGQQ